MLEQITSLKSEIEAEISAIDSSEAIEAFRLRHLVRKGTLQALVEELRNVPKEEKPTVGKALNELRKSTQTAFDAAKAQFEEEVAVKPIDVTLPARGSMIGSIHPITQTLDRIIVRGWCSNR